MKGSITVFMTLCLSVCMLLIGTALESARLALLRSQVSRGMESALDSLFAGYDGDLLDEFGILMLNTEDLNGFNSTESLVKEYLNDELNPRTGRFLVGGNLLCAEAAEVQTVSMSSAVSGQGELFARSVLDYMKYRIAGDLVHLVLDQINLLKQGEEAKAGMDEEENGSLEILDAAETEEPIDPETYEELLEESILGKINALRKNGYLELILPSNRVLSEKTTTKSGFPSNFYSGGSTGNSRLLADVVNNVLYGEYLLDHFDAFTEASGNSVLQYELEYILFGKGSDRKNIEACINRLLLLREGMNIMTIYNSTELEAQAEAFAAALIGWTGIIPLIKIVKAAVIGAWAYGESIVDVRTLLSGHTVPLMKEGTEWILALEGIPSLIDGSFLGIGQYEDGLNYRDYLRLLLFLADEQPKYYRTMDMIQCRLGDYKPRFYMNECVYAVQVKAVVTAKPLFLGVLGGSAPADGYRMQISASRMY